MRNQSTETTEMIDLVDKNIETFIMSIFHMFRN